MVTMNIRVVQYCLPPYNSMCTIGSNRTVIDNPGIETLLLYMKLTAMNFKVDFLTVENGTEMFNCLDNGTADMIGNSQPLNLLYYIKYSATSPIMTDKISLMIKSEQTQNRNLLFSMCHWSVWVLLLFSFIFVILFKITVGYSTKRVIFYSYFYDVPYASWSWVFLIIFSTYTTLLAIVLSQKHPAPIPFKNLAHLAEKLAKKECKLFINSSFAEDMWKLMPSIDGTFYSSAFKKSNPTRVINEQHMINRVLEGGCNIGLIYESEKKAYKLISCNMRFIDLPEFPTYAFVFYYSKNFQYKSKLNKILWLTDWFERHLLEYADHLKLKYCLTENTIDRPLSIYQLSDCFYLLLFGSGLSILLFSWNMAIEKKYNFDRKLKLITNYSIFKQDAKREKQ